MSTTNESSSEPSGLGKQFSRAGLAAPVIAWVLGLCFSTPDPHLVPAKVIADMIRAGFFAAGGLFAVLALAEVLRRGTSGILLAGLVGLAFNSLGVIGAYRNLPDEVRIYRAGNAAADLRSAEATLDFQNLANPNLLKDKPSLEAQRARLEKFLAIARHCIEVLEPGKQVFVKQSSISDPNLDQKTAVIQHINATQELCSREIKLAESAVNVLDLLIQEWGRWKMPPGRFDPTFDAAESAQKYKSLNEAMFAAEQGLAGQQRQIFGQAAIHPGERTVSVTTFNPPLQVHARTPAAASPSAARAAMPATVPNVIDYAKLDFENPAEAAATALATGHDLTGEDALVLQAWSGVLSNLVAASREVERSAKALTDADVLNGSTVVRQGSVPVTQQFVNRRGIANAYRTAVDAWQQRLSGLRGQYLGALYRSNVSPERSQIEQGRLAAATADKVKLQLKICAAEGEVALGYNRAVSSLEMYQQYSSVSQPGPAANNSTIPTRTLPWERPASSNPGATLYGKQLAEQTAKLDELKLAIQQLRQAAQ